MCCCCYTNMRQHLYLGRSSESDTFGRVHLLQVVHRVADALYEDLGFTPYMFKTRHGSGPENPAGSSFPVYPEISVNGNTFYKWSNDNQVYTVLAQPGIVEVSDGYLIFFAGERPPLDSSAMETHEQTVQSPRNLGWVKIGKNIAAKGVRFCNTSVSRSRR